MKTMEQQANTAIKRAVLRYSRMARVYAYNNEAWYRPVEVTVHAVSNRATKRAISYIPWLRKRIKRVTKCAGSGCFRNSGVVVRVGDTTYEG